MLYGSIPSLSPRAAKNQKYGNRMKSSYIDPSLAKGIRRAYLESIETAWKSFVTLRKRDKVRQPYLQVETRKGFEREIEKLRACIEKSGLMQSEITIRSKSRNLWACLFLMRETKDEEKSSNGMTATGHARLKVFALAYPPGQEWVSSMSVRVSAHAIDRVIQRIGIIDLPIRQNDINAVNTEISQSLIWAASAFFILSKTEPKDAPSLTLILPSQYGFFIGKIDPDPLELTLVTYVDRDHSWAEQAEAFKVLDAVTDSQLAYYASDVIARQQVRAEHTKYEDVIYRCWREYGWRIQERIDRTGQPDKAWDSHKN